MLAGDLQALHTQPAQPRQHDAPLTQEIVGDDRS